MLKASIIAAARPNFMKIAPLIRALDATDVSTSLVHTGQHYDQRMSGDFFEQLGIREPDVNLAVGSGSHIFQIAEVMKRLEEVYLKARPDVVIVVGDVNSTLAATLTAVKLGIPVAHVEAGLRSGDRDMPEEVNRILVDAISQWLFVSEPAGVENLKREGVADERVFLVGNIMIDTLFAKLSAARELQVTVRHEVAPLGYALLTLHRPSNVDDPDRLAAILDAVDHLAEQMPVLFPIHPRTAGRLREFGFDERLKKLNYRLLEPLGYLETVGLMDAARLVLTDSGGIQEETTSVRVPCLTLRENTERPITATVGSNRVVGWRTEDVKQAIDAVLAGPQRIGTPPELWDGNTAERIAAHLARLLK